MNANPLYDIEEEQDPIFDELDADKCNQVLWRMRQLQHEIGDYMAQAVIEHARIIDLEADRVTPLQHRLDYLTAHYETMMQDMVAANGGKPVKLLEGKLSMSRETWSAKITDEAHLFDIAEALSPDLIKPVEIIPASVRYGELKKLCTLKNERVTVTHTGEDITDMLDVTVKPSELKVEF